MCRLRGAQSADREGWAAQARKPSLDAAAGWTARARATTPRGRATRSSRAPSSRACPQPSRPVWRPSPLRSPAVGERVGETWVVWLDLQQRLVTADRVVEPGQAVARGEVRCGAGLVRGRCFCLGGLGLGRLGGSVSVSETEGLGVGLPWTPPVAALAIVPATMSMANAMRMILSGFMGSISAERPTNAIGQTANSGRTRGRLKTQSRTSVRGGVLGSCFGLRIRRALRADQEGGVAQARKPSLEDYLAADLSLELTALPAVMTVARLSGHPRAPGSLLTRCERVPYQPEMLTRVISLVAS